MKIVDNKWVKEICWNKHNEITDCDGHMELVDVKISGGQVTHFAEDGQTSHEVSPPTLTKIWACNKCGEVFEE